MKVQLKTELKRAFLNNMLLLSIVLGSIISIGHFIRGNVGKTIYDSNVMYCPESVFYNWIGSSCFAMESYFIYLILPILAVLPYGISLYDDKKSGYIKNVFIRTKKSYYYLAKYIAVFLSGGIAFVTPLVINLFLNAMKFPALMPESIIDIGPSVTCVGWNFYYTHPWLYIILFLLIDFVFAGAVGTISLLVCNMFEHRLTIMIAPFVVYYFVYSLDNILGKNDIAPNYFLIPGFETKYISEFVVSLIVIVIIFNMYMWSEVRNETY